MAVSFVAASNTPIGTGTTSTVTIPALVAAGDLLVLHVMHRDTLTAPNGWDLLEGPTPPVSQFNQMQSVFIKIATAGDVGSDVTLTQASSQRFITHIQAFRPDSETIAVTSSASESSTDPGLMLPALLGNAGQIATVSMTNVYANTDGDETLSPPSGYQSTTPETALDLRLGCAYRVLPSEELIAGRFDLPPARVDEDRAAFSAIIASFFSVSGVVTGADGNPAARTVRLYNRNTGALVESTTSDAITGAYETAPVNSDLEYNRIVLADETALHNDIIDRVTYS